MCDFLLAHGANASAIISAGGEIPPHSAIAKAGRPCYLYVVRLLVEHGANVNARTAPGEPTSAFMRDVRTKGETALHRAAACAGTETIEFLLANGADREARDAHGDSPLTWASEHLRPGPVLSLLSFGEYRIGEASRLGITSDHGAGWGNDMERKLLGDYLPESSPRRKESGAE